MGKYRKVDPKIWNDRRFNELSVPGKLVFIFILTHPNMTALGAMRGTMEGLCSELEGVKLEAFREAFGKPFIKHDPKACFVMLPNFLEYNPPESPNVIKSWISSWDLLPECGLKDELLSHLKDYTQGLSKGFREAFAKAFGKAIAKTMANQEQEQEQEQEKDTTCSEQKNSSEPQVEQPVLSIPLITKDGTHPVYQSEIDDWIKSYPGIDVLQELHKLRQWNIANPKRRKTRAGVLKHIAGWLGKAQDRAGPAPGSNPPPPVTYGQCQDAERRSQVDFLKRFQKGHEDEKPEIEKRPATGGTR